MWSDEPGWWYGQSRRDARIASLLKPVARAVTWAGDRRWQRTVPYRSRLPVICVGNFTAGGTGKTPLSLLLADLLQHRGERPAFLTRGYGGKASSLPTGPHTVNLHQDRADFTGDEALLLARAAPTVIASDRARGAQAIEALEPEGGAPTVIVMDDGLQNPSLLKDLTLAVVDGRRGIGNGLVLPAGPLRAPLKPQLERVDAVVVNRPLAEPLTGPGEPEPRGLGSKETDAPSSFPAWLRANFHGPVLDASARPAADAAVWLQERRWIAFAGIANPQRFFDMLRSHRADLVDTVSFADHHPFTDADAHALIMRAALVDASLITTEKDWVRLHGATGAKSALRDASRTLPVYLSFEDRDAKRLTGLVDATLQTHSRNSLRPY